MLSKSFFNNLLTLVFVLTFPLLGVTQNRYSVTIQQPDVVLPVEISCVSVSDDNKNVISWDRQECNSIKSFNIYRKLTDHGSVWNKIATLNYDDNTLFTDQTGNPLRYSYNYRLSANDQCENEVANGSIHTPIKLSLEQVGDNAMRLKWSKYEGFDVSEYRIYKGTIISNLVRIDIVSGTLNEYLDLCVPDGNLYYRVEALRKPSLSFPEKLKSAKTVQARSNVISRNMLLTELAQNFNDEIIVYPNPMKDHAIVFFSDSFNYASELTLFNLNGKVVLRQMLSPGETEIRSSNLTNGMYIVRISSTRTYWGKLVVQH